MTAEITVRRMTPDDLASWRWLRRDGLTRFPGAFILSSDEYEARTDEAEADFLRHGLVHGVFDGTRPLGMAALRIMPFARARHRAEVGHTPEPCKLQTEVRHPEPVCGGVYQGHRRFDRDPHVAIRDTLQRDPRRTKDVLRIMAQTPKKLGEIQDERTADVGGHIAMLRHILGFDK